MLEDTLDYIENVLEDEERKLKRFGGAEGTTKALLGVKLF